MTELGNGLSTARHHEDALSVKAAEFAMELRLGAPEDTIFGLQSNLASSYQMLGRLDKALSLRRDVYSGYSRLYGEKGRDTLREASNLAHLLIRLQHFEEAKSLMRKMIPVARRTLGDDHRVTLGMGGIYAQTVYKDTCATLDDLREAAETLADTARVARRVLGCAHPLTSAIEGDL